MADNIIVKDANGVDKTMKTHEDGSSVHSPYKIFSTLVEETVPTEGSDGDVMQLWADLFGRLVLYGANLSEGTIDVSVTNDAVVQTLERIDSPLLNAATGTGASDSVDVSLYNKLNFIIVATGVTTGATVKIQASHDISNWVDINTTTVSATGNTEIEFGDVKKKYVRANITARTDGTYTVTMIAGN